MALPEADPGRVLFRIESEWRPPRIIVQSEARAEWNTGFRDFAVLSSPAQQKAVRIGVRDGDVLRFRLRANPTKRLSPGRPGEKVNGARVGLFKEEDQRAWLGRKAAAAGFGLLGVELQPLGTVVSRKNPAKDRARQSHLAVQFDGHLRVTNARDLENAVRSGIGSAKAYGFGLLSLAR
jgi:CRISPR system Cascade subunit CasE